MQEKVLYEYAVIRVVPEVDREEFLNVGVILFSKKQKFLDSRCHLDEERIKIFSPKLDLEVVKEHLLTIHRICRGDADAGPIAKLPLAERFRWLTATRSTIVQTSKTHPGICDDPLQTLQRLFEQLVL
jgi:Protein of unknown function (DUF3037)